MVMAKGLIGYLEKYGELVGIIKYKNAGSPPIRGGRDGV